MLRHLIKNIAISAGSFIAVGVVGLLLVPVLINTYGLDGFGIISMAKLFTPTAALGVFDFGFGETATQAVAKARCDGNWGRGTRLLKMTLLAAALVGSGVGAIVLLLSNRIAEGFSAVPTVQESLGFTLRVTAVFLPLQFISLVFEGILKGFEKFPAQRALEVVSTLTYAGIVIIIMQSNGSVFAVCYAYLATLIMRAMVGGVLVAGIIIPDWSQCSCLVLDEKAWFFQMTKSMAVNKALGFSQTQIAPLVIAFLYGPLGIGTYESLSRLPKALKSVLGLMSATVLPVAARLESVSDKNGMRRLGYAGIIVAGVLLLPPVICAMVFSKPLLVLWVGPDLAKLWRWQTAMFLIPGFTVLLNFGSTALLVRSSVISTMNRWVGLQVVLQFLLAAISIRWFSERAFIFGQVIAVAFTFSPQLRIVLFELDISKLVLKKLIAIVSALIVLGGCASLFLENITSWYLLVISMMVWTVIGWSLGVVFGLSGSQRNRVIGVFQSKISIALKD